MTAIDNSSNYIVTYLAWGTFMLIAKQHYKVHNPLVLAGLGVVGFIPARWWSHAFSRPYDLAANMNWMEHESLMKKHAD